MAKATIVEFFRAPPPPPPPQVSGSITLELNIHEVIVLRTILGRIGGDNPAFRLHASEIWQALDTVLSPRVERARRDVLRAVETVFKLPPHWDSAALNRVVESVPKESV